MASVPPVAVHADSALGGRDVATKIEALGVKLEIPFPKWAVGALAVLVMAAAIGAGYYYWKQHINNSVLIPAAQVEVYEETNYHMTEPDELKEFKKEVFADSTVVSVIHYRSDGCMQFVRYDPIHNKGDGHWMFGPIPHTAGHDHQQTSMSKPAPAGSSLWPLSFETPVHAAAIEGQAATGGKCLNPHPGNFTVENVSQNKCSVQVWRTYTDGCKHYQMFNPCEGTWEVQQNGSPVVHWTHCVH